MPGEEQYVALPDGSYVHVPADATPDQLTQFRSVLSSRYADPLKTGAGMEAAAHEQARETPAKAAAKMQPNFTAMALEHTPSGADPHNAANPNLNAIPESERANVNKRLATVASIATPGAELADEIAGAGSLRPLVPFARSVVGGYYGHKYGAPIGRAAGSVVGLPEVGAQVGGLAGGLAGGYYGYKGLELPSVRNYIRGTVLGEAGGMQIPSRFPAPEMEPPPPLEETAAVPGETAAERLRAHRGDVRTPIPQIPTIRRGPGEILPEAVSSGPAPRVGAPPTSGNTVLPGGAVIKRPPIALLPENVPSAPLPARPLNMPSTAQPEELPRVGAEVQSIRRVPGEIAREAVSSGPEPRVGGPPRSGTSMLPGGGVITRNPIGFLPENVPTAPLPARPLNTPKAAPEPAPELPRISSMDRLKSLIQTEGAGTPPLQKNVPLGEQLFTPRKPATELPSVGQKVSDVINKNTETEAVRPLASGPQKGMKLKDITAPPAEDVPHRATVTHEGKTFGMEAANGKAAYEATKDNPALAKSLHDLRGPEVRNAFMNLGGDVNTVGLEGQRFKVGTSGTNERVQMFDWMFKQGHNPEKIIQAAKTPIEGDFSKPIPPPTLLQEGAETPSEIPSVGKKGLKPLAEPGPTDAELQKKIDTLRDQRNRTNDPDRYKALDKKYKAAMEQFYKGKEEVVAAPAKQSRTATFDSLPPEHQEWITRWAKEINHLPQSLREAEMQELKKFGGQGTLLKERLAMQHLESQKNLLKEPGDENPIGYKPDNEAFRQERANYEQQRERQMRRIKPERNQ